MPQATVYFAGSCFGNPGRGATGVWISSPHGHSIWHERQRLIWCTNHEADYRALISGLQKAKQLGYDDIEVAGHSTTVMNHLMGYSAVASSSMQPLHTQARHCVNLFGRALLTTLHKSNNTRAIQLAREGLDQWKNTNSNNDFCHVFFDGASLNNPGWGGAGWALSLPDRGEVWSGCAALGWDVSNNEAEYEGLIRGAREALRRGCHNVRFFGDSLLVVNQVYGRWKVKSDRLAGLHNEALCVLAQLNSWTLQHVPREQNGRADQLAGMAAEDARDKGARRADTHMNDDDDDDGDGCVQGYGYYGY